MVGTPFKMTQDIMFGAIENFLEMLKEATGVDLLPILNIVKEVFDLDFFDPENPPSPQQIWEHVVEVFILALGVLLGPNSPLNALNLVGRLPNAFLSMLSISSLTNEQPELLVAPTMDWIENVVGGNVWFWDGMEGHTSPGCVKTNAVGTHRDLTSNTIPVASTDVLKIWVWAKWTGLVYTGSQPIQLQVKRYTVTQVGATMVRTLVGTETIAVPTPSGTSGWVQFGTNTYNVPDDCDEIAVNLHVDQTATAGTVFFDDASAKKNGLLSIDWVAGLPPALQDLGTRVQDVIEAGWQSVFGDFENTIEHTADQLRDALKNIPGANVGGPGGFSNIIESLTETWTGIWGGLALEIGGGKSIADVANAASNVAQNSSTSLALGEWNNNILEIRNNKTLMSGMDETSESNFLMDKLFALGAAPPTEVVVSASGSNRPVSFWRATEGALKGFVSWYGRGINNVTGLFIDIYKMNYATSQMQYLFSSPNQIGQFPSDSSYALGIWYIDVGSRIQVTPGEVYGIGWRVTGTGTHYVAGINTGAWLPVDPTVTPGKPSIALAAGSPGNVNFASLPYANPVPWFGFGIVAGDVPEPYHAPRTKVLSTPGPNQAFHVESWMNILDIVYYPGGAGGHGGNGGTGQGGDGGNAGTPVGERLIRGVDYPSGFTGNLLFDVGAGGTGGPRETIGQAGGLTRRQAIASGKAAFSTAGGTPGGGYATDAEENSGKSPGNFTNASGIVVQGGIGASGGSGDGGDGSAPGGGGQGGQGGFWTVAWPGGDGAPGMVHIYQKQIDE